MVKLYSLGGSIYLSCTHAVQLSSPPTPIGGSDGDGGVMESDGAPGAAAGGGSDNTPGASAEDIERLKRMFGS